MNELGRDPSPAPSGDGSGRSLPPALLISCLIATVFSTVYSLFTINAQLRNYRKPILQRHVVRLLLMVPLYSISSLISLFSLQAAFLIDLMRDLYEAFVIYSFFTLLVEYLGGERSILILLHGRDPINHLFPFNYFLGKIDPSDPYTLLAIKRGVLQYVQIKPLLAGLTVILKAMGKYQDGVFSKDNGYTYISTLYNISVFISLYALALLWSCLSSDLQSFRVTSKFLCIKGIIFFSFWQSLAFSFMVSPLRWITSLGPVDDPDFISLALQDSSICFEMVGFAIWHNYAFSWKDYKEKFGGKYQARLPVTFAIRDVVGLKDVYYDSITTIKGQGYDYRLFEPSEGLIHADLARKKRFKAGLRYSKGGQSKYWLPQRTVSSSNLTSTSNHLKPKGPISIIKKFINDQRIANSGYSPLLKDEIDDVVHLDPELIEREKERRRRKLEQERDEGENEIDEEIGIGSSSSGIRKDYGSTQASTNGTAHRQDEQEEGHDEEWETSTSFSTKIITSAKTALKFWPGSTEYLTDQILDSDLPATLKFSDPTSQEMNGRIKDGNHDEELTTEELYDLARKLKFGDYNYPNVDLNREERRKEDWIKDEEIINKWENKKKEQRKAEIEAKKKTKGKEKEKKGKGKERMLEEGLIKPDDESDGDQDSSKDEGKKSKRVWSAWADEEEGSEAGGTNSDPPAQNKSDKSKSKSSNPSSASSPTTKKKASSKQSKSESNTSPCTSPAPGARDLVVEDFEAEERERILERRRGDPAMRAGKSTRIFRRIWNEEEQKEEEVEVEENGEDSKKRGEKAAEISNSVNPIEIESKGHTQVNHDSPGSPQENFGRNKESKGQKKYIDNAHERIKTDLEEVDRENDGRDGEQKKDEDGKQDQQNGNESSNAHHHGKIETAEVGKERKVAREIDVKEAMNNVNPSHSPSSKK